MRKLPPPPLAYISWEAMRRLQLGQNVAGTTLTKHKAYEDDCAIYAHPSEDVAGRSFKTIRARERITPASERVAWDSQNGNFAGTEQTTSPDLSKT